MTNSMRCKFIGYLSMAMRITIPSVKLYDACLCKYFNKQKSYVAIDS